MTNKKGLLGGIYYRFIDNKKDTLLFLHGFTGNSSVWDEQIKLFKKSYNLLLCDLVGHGKSKTPKKIEGYFFKNQASNILKIINSLKISSLIIVCYSYSVYIGLEILGDVPTNTKALIFISPYFGKKYNFIEKQLLKTIKFIWTFLVPNKKYSLDYSKLENYENPTFKDNSYTAKSINTKDVLGSVYALSNLNKNQVNKKINIPILIIYGENDEMFSDEIKQRFNDYKSAKYKKMTGKKHLFLKTKSNEINKYIIDFLSDSLK